MCDQCLKKGVTCKILNLTDYSNTNSRALKGEFGITGLQEKYLGLWDYTLFEIGIIKIRPEIGIMGFHSKQNWDYKLDFSFFMQGNWDYGITPHSKLG